VISLNIIGALNTGGTLNHKSLNINNNQTDKLDEIIQILLLHVQGSNVYETVIEVLDFIHIGEVKLLIN